MRSILVVCFLVVGTLSCGASGDRALAEERSTSPSIVPNRRGVLEAGPTVSPDGKWTVQVDPQNDAVARLTDVATGKPTGPALTHGDSGRMARRKLIWAFAPDGKAFATAFSADTLGGGDTAGDIRVWELPSCRSVGGRSWTQTGYVRALRYSEDGRTLWYDAAPQSGK